MPGQASSAGVTILPSYLLCSSPQRSECDGEPVCSVLFCLAAFAILTSSFSRRFPSFSFSFLPFLPFLFSCQTYRCQCVEHAVIESTTVVNESTSHTVPWTATATAIDTARCYSILYHRHVLRFPFHLSFRFRLPAANEYLYSRR